MADQANNPFSLSLFSTASSFSVGGAPTWPGGSLPSSGIPASSPPPAAPPSRLVRLEVKQLLEGKTVTHTVELPAESRVSELRATLADRLDGPITLVHAGRRLVCDSDQLDELGIGDGAVVMCLMRESPQGPSLTANGPFVPPSPAPAPAASSSGLLHAERAPAAVGHLRITRLNQQKFDVPFHPTMTGMGLKRELEKLGEGSAMGLRLIAGGKELVDHLPLAMQNVRLQSGSVVFLMRRELPAADRGKHQPAAPSKAAPSKFVGLLNQGATCYLNSLVQALYMTPQIRHGVMTFASGGPIAAPLTCALSDVFHQLATSRTAVSTEKLTSALNWGPVSRQQDVHEFWTLLCEKLEREMKGSAQADLIESLFQGTQQYYVTCSECERTSYTADTFQDLKLQVPFGEAAPPLATLHSAFKELLAPEMMRGAERYECEACARKVDAERGVKLHKLPPLLALQLKRFRFDLKTLARVKVNTPLSFPFELDMGEFVSTPEESEDKPSYGSPEAVEMAVDEEVESAALAVSASTHTSPLADKVATKTEYELYAVLVHSGSATFGHYYALIKDVDEGEWHEFNDSTVRPIKETDLTRAFGSGSSGGSAYLLLYRMLSAKQDAQAVDPSSAPASSWGASAPEPMDESVHDTAMLGHDDKRPRVTPTGSPMEEPFPSVLSSDGHSSSAGASMHEDTNPYTTFF